MMASNKQNDSFHSTAYSEPKSRTTINDDISYDFCPGYGSGTQAFSPSPYPLVPSLSSLDGGSVSMSRRPSDSLSGPSSVCLKRKDAPPGANPTRRGRGRPRTTGGPTSTTTANSAGQPPPGRREERRSVPCIINCPYFILDPTQFEECGKLRLNGMSRLTQHFHRQHIPPFHCRTCFAGFKKAEERDRHESNPSPETCMPRLLPPPYFVSEAKRKKLLSLSRNSGGRPSNTAGGPAPSSRDKVVQKWQETWRILFPHVEQKADHYIFMMPHMVRVFRELMACLQSDAAVKPFVSKAMSLGTTAHEETVTQSMAGAMGEVVTGIIEAFIADRQPHDMDMSGLLGGDTESFTNTTTTSWDYGDGTTENDEIGAICNDTSIDPSLLFSNILLDPVDQKLHMAGGWVLGTEGPPLPSGGEGGGDKITLEGYCSSEENTEATIGESAPDIMTPPMQRWIKDTNSIVSDRLIKNAAKGQEGGNQQPRWMC